MTGVVTVRQQTVSVWFLCLPGWKREHECAFILVCIVQTAEVQMSPIFSGFRWLTWQQI